MPTPTTITNRVRARFVMLPSRVGLAAFCAATVASLGLVGVGAFRLHAQVTATATTQAPLARAGGGHAAPVHGGPATKGSSTVAGQGSGSSAPGVGAPGVGAPGPGPDFGAPTLLPGSEGNGSTNFGEPSMAVDSRGNIFVTAPGSLNGNADTAPVWKSSDAGQTFAGPTATNNAGVADSPLGGSDSDIAIDNQNNVYVTDLWLGNTSMSVSTDAGTTWTGIPWGHATGGDDRPWLTYDGSSGRDELYMVWDGYNGIHVGRAVQRTAEAKAGTSDGRASLVMSQDVVAVPESAKYIPALGNSVRNGFAASSNIAVDNNGNLFFLWAQPDSAGTTAALNVAKSTDSGVQWTQSTIAGAAAAEGQGMFQFLRSDSAGNLYAVWPGPVGNTYQVFYSYLAAGSATWSTPVQVSNAGGLAVYANVAVVSPGVIDVSYLDGELVNSSTLQWSVVLAQSTTALSTADFQRTVAYQAIYQGPASGGGGGSVGGLSGTAPGGAPRSPGFGDFYSMVVDPAGMAEIIVNVNTTGNTWKLGFLHQAVPVVEDAAASRPPTLSLPATSSTCPTGSGGTYPFCNSPAYPSAPPNINSASLAPVNEATSGATGNAPPSTSRSKTAPKYPDGVPIASAAPQTPGQPGSGGLAWWVYMLAGMSGLSYLARRFLYTKS